MSQMYQVIISMTNVTNALGPANIPREGQEEGKGGQLQRNVNGGNDLVKL